MKEVLRIQYAISGIAHVLATLTPDQFSSIHSVYLFGSIARKTGTEESDIDVFFNTNTTLQAEKKLRTTIEHAFDTYRLTTAALQYKLTGIHNVFTPIIGRLEEWTELKKSIASSAIQVYGPALLKITKSKQWFVYSWKTMKNRGAFLNSVYGYRVKKKKYDGILQKTRSIKIGKSALAVPREYKELFEQLLKKYNTSYTVQEFSK